MRRQPPTSSSRVSPTRRSHHGAWADHRGMGRAVKGFFAHSDRACRGAMRRGGFLWALAIVAAVETGWLLYPVVRRVVLAIEETPATRGHRLAAELGCFTCHVPEG